MLAAINNGILKTINKGESNMIDRAIQIIETLRKQFPALIFEWENKTWPRMDDSFCTLSVALKTKPDEKASLDFNGIANHSVDDHVQGFIDHAISLLKK